MKNLKLFTLIILAIFAFNSCKKDKTGIDALPPATQEGKGTFGCLVNGVAFTPKSSGLIGPPALSSYYQYINSPTAQGYFFNVSASKRNGGDNGTESVSINSNSKTIQQGQTYSLKNSESNNEIYGNYGIFKGAEINDYATTGIYKGELNITKLDEINQIVSGTFWFDAINNKGVKVEVREGRFDVKFVK